MVHFTYHTHTIIKVFHCNWVYIWFISSPLKLSLWGKNQFKILTHIFISFCSYGINISQCMKCWRFSHVLPYRFLESFTLDNIYNLWYRESWTPQMSSPSRWNGWECCLMWQRDLCTYGSRFRTWDGGAVDYPGGPDLITQPLKVETLSYGIREMRQNEEIPAVCERDSACCCWLWRWRNGAQSQGF